MRAREDLGSSAVGARERCGPGCHIGSTHPLSPVVRRIVSPQDSGKSKHLLSGYAYLKVLESWIAEERYVSLEADLASLLGALHVMRRTISTMHVTHILTPHLDFYGRQNVHTGLPSNP